MTKKLLKCDRTANLSNEFECRYQLLESFIRRDAEIDRHDDPGVFRARYSLVIFAIHAPYIDADGGKSILSVIRPFGVAACCGIQCALTGIECSSWSISTIYPLIIFSFNLNILNVNFKSSLHEFQSVDEKNFSISLNLFPPPLSLRPLWLNLNVHVKFMHTVRFFWTSRSFASNYRIVTDRCRRNSVEQREIRNPSDMLLKKFRPSLFWFETRMPCANQLMTTAHEQLDNNSNLKLWRQIYKCHLA